MSETLKRIREEQIREANAKLFAELDRVKDTMFEVGYLTMIEALISLITDPDFCPNSREMRG